MQNNILPSKTRDVCIIICANKHRKVGIIMARNVNVNVEASAVVENEMANISAALKSTSGDVWKEHASVTPLKVGDSVYVKEIKENKEGSKTKLTITLVASRRGRNGGEFLSFHKVFTNREDLAVGQVCMVTSEGRQWSDEYISKDARPEKLEKPIVCKDGHTFNFKIRVNRTHYAIGIGLM